MKNAEILEMWDKAHREHTCPVPVEFGVSDETRASGVHLPYYMTPTKLCGKPMEFEVNAVPLCAEHHGKLK